MVVRFRLVFAVTLLVLSLGAVGCGGSGFDTPESCFKSIQIAANNKDMPALCNCLTDESTDAIAGMLVMAGSMMQMQAAMTGPAAPGEAQAAATAISTILQKHGVTNEAIQERSTAIARPSPDGIRGLATIVKDKTAFISDMFAAMQQSGQANFGDQFEEQISGELKDVTLDGDQATAVVVTAKGEEPLKFRKTDAGWKLHIDLDAMGSGVAPPA